VRKEENKGKRKKENKKRRKGIEDEREEKKNKILVHFI
jgi:hypothetical protein